MISGERPCGLQCPVNAIRPDWWRRTVIDNINDPNNIQAICDQEIVSSAAALEETKIKTQTTGADAEKVYECIMDCQAISIVRNMQQAVRTRDMALDRSGSVRAVYEY